MKGVIVTVFVPMATPSGHEWICGYDLYDKSMVILSYALDGTLSQNIGRRMYQYSRHMPPRPWTDMFDTLMHTPINWSRAAQAYAKNYSTDQTS